MSTSAELITHLKQSGLSYSQIAKRVGTTKGGVAGILFRARNPELHRERSDLWTEARLTEKWENRKRRLAKK